MTKRHGMIGHIDSGKTSLAAAITRVLAAGCCSAASPCNHQKAHPGTICETCKAAHRSVGERVETTQK